MLERRKRKRKDEANRHWLLRGWAIAWVISDLPRSRVRAALELSGDGVG